MSASTINTNDIANCHPGSKKVVARERGTKVRYRCTECAKIGPWEHKPDYKPMVKSTPNPPIDNKVVIPGDEEHYMKWTVKKLKEHCDMIGVGYGSKSTKPMLVSSIIEKENRR